jgi:CBS domain-containing protein
LTEKSCIEQPQKRAQSLTVRRVFVCPPPITVQVSLENTMTLLVFDMGLRITTPPQPPSRQVNAVAATRPANPVSGYDTSPEHRSPQAVYAGLAGNNPPLLQHTQVAELMSHPVQSLGADASIGDARQGMQNAHCRHLLITGNNCVSAIVSDRDLPADTSLDSHSIMTIARHPVFCTCPDSPVRVAARWFYERRISALPVCLDNGQLVGIITRSDLIRALASEHSLQLDI